MKTQSLFTLPVYSRWHSSVAHHGEKQHRDSHFSGFPSILSCPCHATDNSNSLTFLFLLFPATCMIIFWFVCFFDVSWEGCNVRESTNWWFIAPIRDAEMSSNCSTSQSEKKEQWRISLVPRCPGQQRLVHLLLLLHALFYG